MKEIKILHILPTLIPDWEVVWMDKYYSHEGYNKFRKEIVFRNSPLFIVKDEIDRDIKLGT